MIEGGWKHRARTDVKTDWEMRLYLLPQMGVLLLKKCRFSLAVLALRWLGAVKEFLLNT